MYLLIGTVSQVNCDPWTRGPLVLILRHNQFYLLGGHIYHVKRLGYVLSRKPFKMNVHVNMKLNIY